MRDVRAAAAALSALVPHAVSFGPGIADSIKAACDAVEPALEREEMVVAVVGDLAARRVLLRLVLGESVLRDATGRRERITRVRSADAFDYVTRDKSGKTVRFARVMPDRDPMYQESIEKAESELETARDRRAQLEQEVQNSRERVRAIEVEIVALEGEVEAAGNAFAEAWRAERGAKTTLAAIEKAAPQVPAIYVKTPPWWALWLWFMRWALQSKWKQPLAAWQQNRAELTAAQTRTTDLGEEARGREAARDAVKAKRVEYDGILERAQTDLANAEVRLSNESAVAKAEEQLEALLRERARHAGERKEEFFSDLRAIDSTERGDDVEELDVDYAEGRPGAPPRGVVLVFAEDPPDDADGFILVKDASKPPPRIDLLRAKLPKVATLTVRPGQPVPPPVFAKMAKKDVVVGTRLAIRLRACITDVARARANAEVEHQRRLAALESQRIPHPDDFRKKQVTRSEQAIVDGAVGIVSSSRAKLERGVADLAKEWTDRVAAAKNVRAIEACAREINQRGKMRVLELLEAVSEHVAREMQDVGETLERWALDEIHTKYRTTKKVRAESLAPVASEITGEDLAAEIAPRVPIPTAVAEFKKQRFRIALAGAVSLGAAGAGVAGLAGAHAGIAAGAVAGIALGSAGALVKPAASLRAACLASIQRYAAEVTRSACSVVDGKHAEVENGLRSSLDAALAEALDRLNDAITRLMTVERNAIEGERAALAKLASTHATLEEHAARLAARIGEVDKFFDAG